MGRPDQLSRGARAARLARSAADCLIDGTDVDAGDRSLYQRSGRCGPRAAQGIPALRDDRCRETAARGADALSAQVDGLEGSSLYFGLAGVAAALRALGRDAAADRALTGFVIGSAGSDGTRCSSSSWVMRASDSARFTAAI
jgi:hypothetical protein